MIANRFARLVHRKEVHRKEVHWNEKPFVAYVRNYRQITFRNRLNSAWSEEGSAITEFLILTLPLFLPLIIFLTDFSILTNREVNYQTIARQAIRAFVSSENVSQGTADVQFIMEQAGIRNKVDVSIQCVSGPCFTPETLVKLTLSRKNSFHSVSHNETGAIPYAELEREREIVATVYERFDRWYSP